jgi:hypothetical protein
MNKAAAQSTASCLFPYNISTRSHDALWALLACLNALLRHTPGHFDEVKKHGQRPSIAFLMVK